MWVARKNEAICDSQLLIRQFMSEGIKSEDRFVPQNGTKSVFGANNQVRPVPAKRNPFSR
jgi:hypothetical protein